MRCLNTDFQAVRKPPSTSDQSHTHDLEHLTLQKMYHFTKTYIHLLLKLSES